MHVKHPARLCLGPQPHGWDWVRDVSGVGARGSEYRPGDIFMPPSPRIGGEGHYVGR